METQISTLTYKRIWVAAKPKKCKPCSGSNRAYIGNHLVFFECSHRPNQTWDFVYETQTWRSRTYCLQLGETVKLPNGAMMTLLEGKNKKVRVELEIPVGLKFYKGNLCRKGFAAEPKVEATQLNNSVVACETPGCNETAYGTKLCSLCLDGKTPLKRGPVTVSELLHARLIGGKDLEVTRQRLKEHGQPDNGTC